MFYVIWIIISSGVLGYAHSYEEFEWLKCPATASIICGALSWIDSWF